MIYREIQKALRAYGEVLRLVRRLPEETRAYYTKFARENFVNYREIDPKDDAAVNELLHRALTHKTPPNPLSLLCTRNQTSLNNGSFIAGRIQASKHPNLSAPRSHPPPPAARRLLRRPPESRAPPPAALCHAIMQTNPSSITFTLLPLQGRHHQAPPRQGPEVAPDRKSKGRAAADKDKGTKFTAEDIMQTTD